jgi:hypothetical protein
LKQIKKKKKCSKKHEILKESEDSVRTDEEKRNEYTKTRAAKNKLKINANDDILGETCTIKLTADATQPKILE